VKKRPLPRLGTCPLTQSCGVLRLREGHLGKLSLRHFPDWTRGIGAHPIHTEEPRTPVWATGSLSITHSPFEKTPVPDAWHVAPYWRAGLFDFVGVTF
jgi:hypothetical protein